MFLGGQKINCLWQKNRGKIGVNNDPLGQTQSLASSEHCFRLKLVCFLDFDKCGRTYAWTDNMCENNDHYRDCGTAEWITTPHELNLMQSSNANQFHKNNCFEKAKQCYCRGVDVNKRTVTTHSYSLLKGKTFGHYMSSC